MPTHSRRSRGYLTLADQGKITYDPIPDVDHTATGEIISATVDSNATGFGAALYLASDGHYDEADSTGIATMLCTALALETGTGTKNVLLKGYIRDDSWNWTVGGKIYVSETTGALTQTAPTTTDSVTQVVGYAISADVMKFDPSLNYLTHT